MGTHFFTIPGKSTHTDYKPVVFPGLMQLFNPTSWPPNYKRFPNASYSTFPRLFYLCLGSHLFPLASGFLEELFTPFLLLLSALVFFFSPLIHCNLAFTFTRLKLIPVKIAMISRSLHLLTKTFYSLYFTLHSHLSQPQLCTSLPVLFFSIIIIQHIKILHIYLFIINISH